MIPAIGLFAPLLLVAALDDVTLTFEVAKGGDVRWKSEPCSADVYGKDKNSHVDDVTAVTVSPGTVDVVVACAAAEGIVKKTVRVNAKKDQTLKVSFIPGFLLTSIEREGKLTVGNVVVYDAYDHEVARGRDRTALAVEAGTVRVLGIVEKGTANTSRDVRGEQKTRVTAGNKSEIKLDASDGELLVNVTENGRPAKAIVALREPGSSNRAIEITPGTAMTVPAGTWDLVSQLEDAHDFRELLTKNVVIEGKKTTKKQLSHSTGKLVAVVAPADAANVVIDLLLPGATAGFNQIDPNTEARLSPGKYVVRATKDAALDDGSKPQAQQTVTVSAGGTARVTVNPAVAHLDVEVRVGGEAKPLPVELTLPGADAPLALRAADAAGLASFNVGPQAVEVSTTLTTPHGPLSAKKQIVLKAGQNRVRLDIDVGTVVVQVIDGGAAVAAEVGYYTRLKSGLPTGDAVVAVKAGEEAFLPPGIYVLAVKRKGEQRVFGEVKVAPGRLIERSLDWSPPAPATTTPAAADKKDEKKDEKKTPKADAAPKEGATKEAPRGEPKPEPKPAPKAEPKPAKG